ncbi:MAG: cupin domain-containing protein [Candidatus Omnitrophica bacterium]|nr:cupin domain-containing protein [Candidatus Omnitrophota bacterium]
MKIGKRLRDLRKEKGMTLNELSRKSGVALATLSRMENDKMTGTIQAHSSICKALGVSITELYKELENEQKTVDPLPGKERTEHYVHANKASYELLVSKAPGKKLMPLMMKIDSGGATQNEQNRPGMEKFVYVITGTLEASVGDKNYTLKPGDSLYFDASLPHTFNNRTKKRAEAICIVTPPAI